MGSTLATNREQIGNKLTKNTREITPEQREELGRRQQKLVGLARRRKTKKRKVRGIGDSSFLNWP